MVLIDLTVTDDFNLLQNLSEMRREREIVKVLTHVRAFTLEKSEIFTIRDFDRFSKRFILI